VQLSLPLSGTANTPRDAVLFVRHRRARRYILRVLGDGTLRVTLPRWGARRDAQAFVDASREWIARQRAARMDRARPSSVWGLGSLVLIDGHLVRLELDAGTGSIMCAGIRVGTHMAGNLRPMVEAWLRNRAKRELPGQLLALAAQHGILVARVSIRDQRSRWGACSPSGTITLNWRLLQTPPHVREYVLLHELMHRRELNHSRRFWKLVAAVCPQHADARRWLRKEGKSLWPDSV
jgi:predicted metal-dependent hydrolase